MCTNQRKIRNRYTGQTLYVKCGKCPACQQQKAAYRAARIRANDSDKMDCLIVTLTYRRDACPYILREDGYNFSRGRILSLPVYRDCEFRKVRFNANYDIGYSKSIGRRKIASVDYVHPLDFSKNKDLKFQSGKIGVCLYTDYQKFMARLRLNLERRFNYYERFKTYSCSEYGTKSKRPHFHLLFWIRKGDFEIFRNAIISSWPYGDLQKFERSVEVAKRASSYVASYVNSGSDFPNFLKDAFPPKHSYSKFFGSDAPLFQLPKILEKFRGGHLTYNCLKVQSGKIIECLYPKYVIHRYFPLFKGYNRFASSSFQSIATRLMEFTEPNEVNLMLEDSSLYENAVPLLEHSNVYLPCQCTDIDFFRRMINPVTYSDDDIHKVSVRLNNAYRRFCSVMGNDLSREDYIRLHRSVWSLYVSEVLRLHLQNDEVPLNEKYYNLDEVDFKNRMPVGFSERDFAETDPNKFSSVVSSTSYFKDAFYKNVKHRNVTNVVLSSIYEEF